MMRETEFDLSRRKTYEISRRAKHVKNVSSTSRFFSGKMSWFWGHILPGTGWLLMAIFHYLQSLQHIQFLKPLRTRPFWIVFRSLCVMSFCVAGVLGRLSFDD